MKHLFGRVNGGKFLLVVIALSLALDLDWTAGAHEGEQHGTPAPGGGGARGGPVTLTPEARRNLGLETAPVEKRSLVIGPTGFAWKWEYPAVQ